MNIGKKEILSLYKRCIRAAKKCPSSEYRIAMLDYVKYIVIVILVIRYSFKQSKTALGDERIRSLYQYCFNKLIMCRRGIEELESMEKYHNAVKMQKEENDKANREFLNS